MADAHGHGFEELAAGDGASDDAGRSIGEWARGVGRLVTVIAGMSGVRIDRGARSWVAIALGAASWLVAVAFVEAQRPWAYVVGAWALYYGGNTLLLTGPAHQTMLRRFGERKAYAVYERVVGAMFVNQGLAIAVASHPDAGAIALPVALAKSLAISLFFVGFGCKLWATHLTGLDVYYYRDMFTRQPLAELVAHGPYRWLTNPMYGLGNLHMYAAALWFRSWTALGCALTFHVSIYVFDRFVERPFVQRVYGAG